MSASLDERFGPLLGGSVWHTATVDPTLQEVSELHFHAVQDILARHGKHLPSVPQILEVAAYAHVAGYSLAHRQGAKELARMEVYQPESFLLAGIAESPSNDSVLLKMVSLDDGAAPPYAQVSLAYVGAVSL